MKKILLKAILLAYSMSLSTNAFSMDEKIEDLFNGATHRRFDNSGGDRTEIIKIWLGYNQDTDDKVKEDRLALLNELWNTPEFSPFSDPDALVGIGKFIVRLSSSTPGALTVTKRFGNQNKHYRYETRGRRIISHRKSKKELTFEELVEEFSVEGSTNQNYTRV